MSRADPLPPIEDVLPHAGGMVLLSRVLSHERHRTVCEVEIDRQSLLGDGSGGAEAWIGLEYMAQCVAAHGGLIGRTRGEPPRLGLLLGSRRLTFHTEGFHPGQTLAVTAERVWGGSEGLVSFDCRVEDGETGDLLVEGRLSCLQTGTAELRGALP